MLTLTEYKRNMIAPLNLFFLFTVSRMLIVFTISSVVLKSTYSFDIIISIAASFVIIMLLSIPVIKLIESNKNVSNSKIIAFAYGIYFIYAGSINVSKFAMFSSTELNQNAKLLFLAATMIAACIYAASLRIEAISRFGSFVFVLMVLGVVGLTGFCAKDFSSLNLFPIVQNSKMQMLNNMLFSVASTNELLLIFVLAPKVNGKIKKPFYFSMVLSYLIAMLMVVLVIGVLGDTASLVSYPVFEASELAKLGTNERLESIFIALWIFAIFLKTTLYLYCASQCFKGKKAGTKCVACGCVMLLAAWLILSGNAYDRLENIFVIIPYFVFAAVIPCGYLIFGKRKSGDDLIEAFKNN